MGFLRRGTLYGIELSEDERYRKKFINKSIAIMVSGIIGGPFIIYYFMFYERWGNVIKNIRSMDTGRFLIFWLLCVITSGCIVLMSLNTYYREKGSRRGREHGSSKFASISDMPVFRCGFFFDPKIVKKCRGFEKEGTRTHFNRLELKTVMVSTRKCERDYRRHPIKPLNEPLDTAVRRKVAGKWSVNVSPSYRCFLKSQIIGQDVYMSMNADFIKRNLNTVTLGGSGQGKSYSILFPNVMQANANYVITDPSGEILQKCGKFLQMQGYSIKVFNIKEFNLSMRYNPIKYVETEQDVSILVSSINNNIDGENVQKGGSGKFFDDAQMALTTALISALREIYPKNPEKQTLFNLMELLRLSKKEVDAKTGAQYSELDHVFDELKAKNPRSYAVRMYENFKVADKKVGGEILMSATAVFGKFFDSNAISKLCEDDDLDLYDFVTGLDENGKPLKCALFLIIPQDTREYNFLASMLYSQIFAIATKGGERWRDSHPGLEEPRLPRHLSLWLDEFANIGKIPSFPDMISVVRKYNVSINIILQTISQLEALYKDHCDTIIGNCDTAIFLGGQDQKSVRYIMEKLGKETIKTHSSTQNGNKSGSLSQQTTGRELMSASDIAGMSRALEIAFITGFKPFKIYKYDLSKHPNYKYFGSADPEKNSLNVREFNYVAKDGHSGEETRTLNKYIDTGKKDNFNIPVMRLVKVIEPILDDEDRQIRIDNNTIDIDMLHEDIEKLSDRTYSVDKKIRALKNVWTNAKVKKDECDMFLKTLKKNMEDGVYVDPNELKEAAKELIRASDITSKKHLDYLYAKKKDIEGRLSNMPDDKDEYIELSNRLNEIQMDIEDETDSAGKEKNTMAVIKNAMPRITIEELNKNGLKPDEKLNERQIEAAQKVENAPINEDFKEGINKIVTPAATIIRLSGSGMKIIDG